MISTPMTSLLRPLAVALLTLSAPLVRAVDEDNLHALLLPEDKQNPAYRWLNIAEGEQRHGERAQQRSHGG